MGKKDRVTLAKSIAIKRLRNRARLEAAIRVDIVLNEIEDDFVEEFNRRVMDRQPFELASYETWVVDAIDQKFPALPAGDGSE